MCPSTGFRQSGGNINRLQLVTLAFLLPQRYRIRDYNATQATPVEVFDRVATENAVRDNGDDFVRTVRHDCVCSFDERAACIGHVVDEDGYTILHVTNENHTCDFVWAGALFVDEGKAEVETVGD